MEIQPKRSSDACPKQRMIVVPVPDVPEVDGLGDSDLFTSGQRHRNGIDVLVQSYRKPHAAPSHRW
jgi:hypothetical protein